MFKKKTKYAIAIAGAIGFSVAAAGCSAPPAESTSAAGSGPSGCLVADTAGINDHGFNEQAWGGLLEAENELGSDVRYLHAQSTNDYATQIDAFVKQDCDLIVTVGFLMGDATKAASEANPDARFAIVDVSYDPSLPNVQGLSFATDQGAFEAGFVAAAASKTGVVGTFGGVKIAPVELYMDGFARGVEYYNTMNGADVTVLGWNVDAQDGTFLGNFTDQEGAKQIAQGMMQQQADIIYPVASAASLGAYAAVQANGNGVLAIKGDTDGCAVYPQYCDIFLVSVLKKVETAVFDSMSSVADGSFEGSTYVGTLANGGVGITDVSGKIPAEVEKQLEQINSDLTDGSLEVGSPFGLEG